MNIEKPVVGFSVKLGCDPEFFFKQNGQVIGSEKVIDIKNGLPMTNRVSKFIVDGVQAELNPAPNSCRANLANEISYCFKVLRDKLKADHGDISASFAPVEEISREELESLDTSSRVFGCAPSMNTNPESRGSATLVDPSEYRYRSAGGHIHLGRLLPADGYYGTNAALDNPEALIPIMDVLVGNTCVLIDRDPGNIERRKVYGRAGEYRTPAHGVEYRTLSNFWLRAYPLMSLVMSLARFSSDIVSNPPEYAETLLSLVNMEDIHKAINENDFDLAMANYQKVKPFILAAAQTLGDRHPITKNNVDDFEYFVKLGIDHWFTRDPIEHWTNLPECHTGGWEHFLVYTVRPQRRLAVEAVNAKEEIAATTQATAPKKSTKKVAKVAAAEQPFLRVDVA